MSSQIYPPLSRYTPKSGLQWRRSAQSPNLEMKIIPLLEDCNEDFDIFESPLDSDEESIVMVRAEILQYQ